MASFTWKTLSLRSIALKSGAHHGKKNLAATFESSLKPHGLKDFYSLQRQPRHGYHGFQLDRGQSLLNKWNLIPDDTDILVTHGPPLGYGDHARGQRHVGCVDLLNTVRMRVKPQFHIFGHIHEGMF
jgi:hypothetical protein